MDDIVLYFLVIYALFMVIDTIRNLFLFRSDFYRQLAAFIQNIVLDAGFAFIATVMVVLLQMAIHWILKGI